VDAAQDTSAEGLDDPIVAAWLARPHHDGSELYVDRIGDAAELRLRAPEGAADAVLLRYVKDGEPRTVEATVATKAGGEVWWHAELPLRNPVVSYRWLLTGGELGYRWVNGTGAYGHEVTPSDDFVLTADADGGPEWHLSAVGYEIFIDRFAAGGAAKEVPEWALPREWDAIPESPSENTNLELFGGDLPGIEQHLDHIDALGANVVYLTPFFPAPSNHRYDVSAFDRVDSLVGGDEALASLARAARDLGIRLVGDLPLDHTGPEHEWLRRASDDESAVERSFFLADRAGGRGYATWQGTEFPRFDWSSEDLRERMAGVVRQWLDAGLDGWRISAATMVGRHRDADLNAEIARWMRVQTGDGLVVAEYWNDFRPDVDGCGWHGVMNYAGFLRPVWWWLRADAPHRPAYDVFTGAPAPSYGGVGAPVKTS
jgi:alpha-glucosidase